jgi:hypothetical protein
MSSKRKRREAVRAKFAPPGPTTPPKPPKHPLVLGHKIHFRKTQQGIWIGMSILLGSGFIAGLYWIILQQRYPFLPGSGSLKNWWDDGMGFIHSGNWDAYRHGIRDGGEPAAWTLIGATLLGKVKFRERMLSLKWLFPAMILLLACIIAGTVGITWVTHFGPLSHVGDTFSWQQLLLGVILGRVLHLLWAPIGNTIRCHIITTAVMTGNVPLWVRFPLLSPTWREGWAERKQETSSVSQAKAALPDEEHHHIMRWVVPLTVFVFVFIAVVGNLAKYGVARGAHIPVMNP